MEQLIGERELEWIMIDASYVKAHAHACGARGGNQGIAAMITIAMIVLGISMGSFIDRLVHPVRPEEHGKD